MQTREQLTKSSQSAPVNGPKQGAPSKLTQSKQVAAAPAELEQTIHQKNLGKAPSFQGVLIIPHEYKPVPRMLVQDAPLPLASVATPSAVASTRDNTLEAGAKNSASVAVTGDGAPEAGTRNGAPEADIKNNNYQKVLEQARQLTESGALDDEEYGTRWFAANPRFQKEKAREAIIKSAQPEAPITEAKTEIPEAKEETPGIKATKEIPEAKEEAPGAEAKTEITEAKGLAEETSGAEAKTEALAMEVAAADVVADIKAELEIPELAAKIEAEKKLEKSEKKPIFSVKKRVLHFKKPQKQPQKELEKSQKELEKSQKELEKSQKELEKSQKEEKAPQDSKTALKKSKASPFSLFSRPKRHYSNRLSYDDLINLEAKVGRTVFGPIPEGHRREFFEHRKNVWFWHESYVDPSGITRDTTVFYEVRPTGVFKQLLGSASYKKVEGEELTNFRTAAKTYLNLIKTKVYSQ